ncbi:MAG: hypothetical protein MJK04_14735, partial [Psychrosphaera sp.]|nr:hypothetical protein [Psychrosphaera sp.]
MNKLKLSLITTAFVSCGFTAQALAVEDQTPVVTQSQNVEESYYEDSDDFDVAGSQSNAGWGWSKNVAKDPLGAMGSDSESTGVIIIDDPEETDIEPPSPIPAVPGRISYTPYTALGQSSINWSTSFGQSVSYHLYQQKDNGNWNVIYNGASTSYAVAGLADGMYQYKVKACTSGGCSDYQTHTYMQVRRDANAGIALVGTGLKHKAASPKSMAAMAAMAGRIAQLGYGFDAVNGEPGSTHCWDVATDADIVGSIVTAHTKDFNFSIAETSAALATALEINSTTGLSIAYGGYSAEFQSTKQLYNISASSSNSSYIVAKFKDTRKVITAKGEPTLALTNTALNHLSTNHTNFRTNCGDKYIDQLTMGRYFYLTIQVSATNKSQQDITAITEALKVDLGSIDGDYSTARKESLKSSYDEYQLNIYVVSVGSGIGVTPLANVTKLFDFMNDFENGPNDTLYPVDYSTKYYNIPDEYNTGDHFSVFPNYIPSLTNVQSWLSLDQQVNDRCKYASHVNVNDSHIDKGKRFGEMRFAVGDQKLDYYCSDAKRVILNNQQNCAEHQRWGSCYSPTSSQCNDTHLNTGSIQCMTNIDKIPYWNSQTIEGSLSAYQGGGTFTRQYSSDTDVICLSSESFLNSDIYWNEGNYPSPEIKGFGTTQIRDQRVEQVTHNKIVQNGQQCVSSFAEVYNKPWWGAGG